MTRAEWNNICAGMVAKWPHADLPKSTQAQFFSDLQHLPGDHVAAGVEALYRDGRDFPPNGAQILAKVAELALDAPDWAVAFRELEQCVAAGMGGPYDRPEFDAQAIERILRAAAPMVGAFVDTIGKRQVYAAFAEGGGGEARLREKWLAFIRRAHRERTLGTLPPVDLATINRINRGPRHIGPALERLVSSEDGGDAP